MSNEPRKSIIVGDIAKSSAIEWIYPGQPDKQQAVMSKEFVKWPYPDYQLAIHIQRAIDAAVVDKPAQPC